MAGTHAHAGGWGALKGTARHVGAQKGKLRIALSMLKLNQADGFDCPGCAWPDPADPGDRSAFEFCENGAKAVAWEATKKRCDPAFFAKHTVAELDTWSDHQLEAVGRLTRPMRYDAATDRYEELSWDDAYRRVGGRLAGLSDPDRGVFYTSGRTSNEAAFLYQLLGRRLGTNNFPDCSNMCHESSGVAMAASIGVGKGTVTLEDFGLADMILVIGQNPGTNHPRMLTELEKASRRGCSIVSINPMRERAMQGFVHPQHAVAMTLNRPTPIASEFVQPVIGGDLALFTGLCKAVLELPEGTIDRGFIAAHTIGFDAFEAAVKAEPWEALAFRSGVGVERMQELGRLYAGRERVIACWAMGLTQQRDAVATIQMVLNLLLVRGNLGRPGAGACPVRGHSNVQGDRTMGITERPPAALLGNLQRRFGFQPPAEHGLDVVDSIHAMERGEVDVFIGLGGNFVSATPDTARTSAAMRRVGLTVHVSTKLNRSHLVHGTDALILPCLGRTEADVTAAGPQAVSVEDSMSMVHLTRGRNPPADPDLPGEPTLVSRIAAAAFGPGDPADWSRFGEDYAAVRDAIADVIPGFERFNQRLAENPGGFWLGNSAARLEFENPERKARFIVGETRAPSVPEGCLRLMTLRSHDQYNTTVYGLNDRYRGVSGKRDVLFVNAEDAAGLGLAEGERVDVRRAAGPADGEAGEAEMPTVRGFELLFHDLPRGCCAGYFPELNALVSLDSVAVGSNTPVSKLVPVRLFPS
ncbi:FdhF/YdeP family oxidoreductase [Phycisphaera mikurensis]|uniref:Putative oxidoreductase n=1 Tax=Phycisphaera mikurensis (strain NBRC 102666 / KCTC 22515 / FYK2301M01) TaxID=1142394 RepID=I0IEY1_PHYMF|nr:FdhF/YdeP family oxidoreductase [Phycisphaera mikurensis]MBB6441613.1 molybdopterin-dependent oxidoreductase alpha subunit [Phycisphaera mikurensis]BAM03819.1 putative oxidoreductase [Phycisphaera mikurensis NBRC 102666]